MNDTTTPILVTGALGNIGRSVVTDLVNAGRSVRAADIDATKVSEAFGESVEAVRFDFTDPSTWDSAFAGVTLMFLMRPPQLSNIKRDMVPSLEAAKAAGVKHIVLLSLQGAENNKVVPHAKIEAWLLQSGLNWTFVRPSFFMENLSTTHVTDIRDRDEIMVPAGNGKTAFVAAADVAAVASVALLNPAAHVDRAWTPTGPAALTYEQVAATLTDVIGRPIRYAKPGVAAYMRHASSVLGMPRAMVLVTLAIYSIARLGKAAGLTDDVAEVTGKPPMSFADWAVANREVWLPDACQ